MANQVRTKNRKQKILVSRLVLRNRLLALILLATTAKIDPRNKVDREPEMGEEKRALLARGARSSGRTCLAFPASLWKKGRSFAELERVFQFLKCSHKTDLAQEAFAP